MNSPSLGELLNQQLDPISHVNSANKVRAIKLLREQTGCGLREAKDAVEIITNPPTMGELVARLFAMKRTLVHIQFPQQVALERLTLALYEANYEFGEALAIIAAAYPDLASTTIHATMETRTEWAQ